MKTMRVTGAEHDLCVRVHNAHKADLTNEEADALNQVAIAYPCGERVSEELWWRAHRAIVSRGYVGFV